MDKVEMTENDIYKSINDIWDLVTKIFSARN